MDMEIMRLADMEIVRQMDDTGYFVANEDIGTGEYLPL